MNQWTNIIQIDQWMDEWLGRKIDNGQMNVDNGCMVSDMSIQLIINLPIPINIAS